MCLSRRRIAALFQSNGVIAGMRCQAEEKSEKHICIYIGLAFQMVGVDVMVLTC